MSSDNVIIANDTDFSKVIGNTSLVVVDFWAEWCGPCRQLSPTISMLADKYKDKGVSVVKVNVDDSPETSAKENIRSIPTIIIYHNGKRVGEKVGSLSYEVLSSWLESHMHG